MKSKQRIKTFVWIRQVKFLILITKFEIWFIQLSAALLKQVFFPPQNYQNNFVENSLVWFMVLNSFSTIFQLYRGSKFYW
jgi:hypothetical protein